MSGQGTPAAAQARTAKSAREKTAVTNDDIFVGRDVLELVTSAMYVDPMTIYREYIQNAADAIDEAGEKGILGEDESGRVDIAVDPATRSVRIRDNGTGLGWRRFTRRLTALGASGKRGTEARGFRGVGRLAGLGYAQELVFRSRIAGEERVSELTWDCRRLREALRSAEADTGVGDLIRSIVEVSRFEDDDYPERFFEVELKGIVRLRGDKLMSPAAIAEYLGQVAPVPLSPAFRFAGEIAETLREFIYLGDLEIHVEGIEGPVYRPFENTMAIDERRSISFDRLEVLQVPSVDGDVAGIAWILHHDYEGALPATSPVKGLRLRAGNIQVGDSVILEELFPETRFNAWAVGEVHVIDRRVVPNGRRDHFEQNAHYHNLINHLTPLTREIARLCRSSSVRRKWLREFELNRDTVREKIGVIEQGSLSDKNRSAIALTAEQALLQMEKISAVELLRDDNPEVFKAMTDELRSQLSRAMEDKIEGRSPLMRLPSVKRVMYEELFAMIYECSTNRMAAKALIDRILLKLG